MIVKIHIMNASGSSTTTPKPVQIIITTIIQRIICATACPQFYTISVTTSGKNIFTLIARTFILSTPLRTDCRNVRKRFIVGLLSLLLTIIYDRFMFHGSNTSKSSMVFA